MFRIYCLEIMQEVSTGSHRREKRGRGVRFGTFEQFRDISDVSIVAGGDVHRPAHRFLFCRCSAEMVVSDGLAGGIGQNPSYGF